jgi:LysW-gamma-L-lysine carboxypeptidase
MESPRTPVARGLRGAIRAAGGEPRLLRKTGTADVNLYSEAWDCPTASYGPGDSSLDHTPDEHLALDEFDRAVDVLADLPGRL